MFTFFVPHLEGK